MKNMTRALALLLALILVLGLVVTGFADDAASGTSAATKGKITINDAVVGQSYSIYKILTLESYDKTANAYSYKPASNLWKTFLTTGDGNAYFEVKSNTSDNIEADYVTWRSNPGETEAQKQSRAAEFAKKALAYATTKGITATATQDNVNAQTVTFSNLDLGYYLLDSSLGTLCSLDTTNSDVTIEEKNAVPENKKLVQEDSKENEQDGGWTNTNDADIGQTVNFKSTIKAQAGAQKYVFHDTMSAGLTFDSTSVKVTKNGTEVPAEATNYILKSKTDGTTTFTDGCTFEIEFKQTFCDSLKANDTIVITYSATLNEKAVIAGSGNTNQSQLSYGDNSKTEVSQTTTKTWEVKVFKFHTNATDGNGLAGATFKLSKEENGNNPIQLKATTTANTYRVAMHKDETQFEDGATTEITTTDTGKFTIQGLDSDTYYLTETKAPDGYNKLKAPIKIVIDENGNVKVNDATTPVAEVGVENKTGAEMPSTGGIGTTVFYVVGGILAVGAAVLLVTKKRMERS